MNKTPVNILKQQRYLRKKNTNEIFIWTPLLAKRNDMEEVNNETASQIIMKVPCSDIPTIVIREVQDEERINSIIEKIEKCEYTKRPNIFNFADRTGMKITSAERDTAWSKYLEKCLSKVGA